MKIGDIVYLKQYTNVLGEVRALNENDTVTLSLCDTGVEITVDMAELSVEAGANNPHFEDRVVHILGVEYRIQFRNSKADLKIIKSDGYVDPSEKTIGIGIFQYDNGSLRNLSSYTRKVMRHEIVHAFLYESGLWNNSHETKDWARDEEMVDWVAIQAPKLFKAFKEAGCDEG